MPVDWNKAIQYANLVKIAEAVKPDENYGQPHLDEIKKAGYVFLHAIYGDDLATDLDYHLGGSVTFGFVALSKDEIVVAIRGTDTILEWIQDAKFLMVPSSIPNTTCLVEDGFSSVYESLRTGSYIDRPLVNLFKTFTWRNLTIAGHSLGAALSTLLALDVAVNTKYKPTCYTFAGPRVGDHFFAHKYNKHVPDTFRIVNNSDIVPKLPSVMPLPYEHVDTLYELKPGPDIAEHVQCQHHLTTYLYMMSKLAGLSGYPLNTECQAKQ